jgi:hypothetical protein
MNEFLLFAVIVVYLAICYGRPNSQANGDRKAVRTTASLARPPEPKIIELRAAEMR